jgi:hypothetical protein
MSPLFVNQGLESLECPKEGVQTNLRQGGQLSCSIPAVTAMNQGMTVVVMNMLFSKSLLKYFFPKKLSHKEKLTCTIIKVPSKMDRMCLSHPDLSRASFENVDKFEVMTAILG